MTYTRETVTYRVAFDTQRNQFMAIDAANENRIAYGITIEEAVRNLNA